MSWLAADRLVAVVSLLALAYLCWCMWKAER
jgi:cytochrome c-type biogenesis protein CcmH/NrfG